MMYRKSFAAALAVFLFATAAVAQRAEVSVSVNEVFFDSLLDSMYQNFDAPKFSVGGETSTIWDECIRITGGVYLWRTGVKFRGGVV